MTMAIQLPVEVKKKASRDGFGDALMFLGEHNPDVVVLSADLTESVRAQKFQATFPRRFFSMGVAEQGMVATACGLAHAGKIPLAVSFGIFVSGRAWEMIRTSVCYSELNVKICGGHTGITVGPDGATHQCLEDIACMRVLPNMTVLVPADSNQTRAAALAMVEHVHGPTYLRFGRESLPNFTDPDAPFVVGQSQLLREGSDLTIIACGICCWIAMQGAELLAEQTGLEARVINMHTIKPIDRAAIASAAAETGAILTFEEAQTTAGLGGAVAEVVVETCPVPMSFMGMPNRFGESGNVPELLAKFGYTPENVVLHARALHARKRK